MIYSSSLINNSVDRYTDTISGEKLYVSKGPGETCYYKNRGETIYHRLDGPALVSKGGYKAWYVNNKRHRFDGGPAVEYSNGHKLWYVNGVFIMELDKDGKITKRMK